MSETNKKSLFISYRRADSPDTVKLIYERLKQALPRWEIFYDHKSIEFGEAFPERLRAEVTRADVVLVIIGPKWLEVLEARKNLPALDHVREEVRLAIQSNHTVIPVPVANAKNLSGNDLADFPDLQALATFNSRPIRPEPDFDNDLNSLVTFLEKIGPGEGPGSVLSGKYKLVRVLGEGGMGIVWLAEQLQPKRNVAVKLIKLGMDSKEILARFHAERQALAVLEHPHIAKVIDAGTAISGRPYFAMEYVKGIPITEFCDNHKLTPDERLRLFSQACDAVQHAHQKGIIHRDIKPGNVLVENVQDQPLCKVIDFGLAKALGQKLTDMTLHTAFTSFVGTLEYSSPEQSAGGATDVDTRTDIYSLGALLYELLAGEPPFSREELLKAGEIEMRRVIQEKDPLRPSAKLNSSSALPAIAVSRHLEPKKLTALLRGDLDWIVMKALEKDRSRRYDSASGLAEEIQRYLAGDPVQARPPSTGYRIQKYVRKHKGLVASILSIATLLILGIIGTSWFGIQAELAKQDALTQREIADEKTIVALKAEAIATEQRKKTELALEQSEATLARSNYYLALARWDANRTHEANNLLELVPAKHRKFEWHLARRQFRGGYMTCYGHSSGVTSLAFSPDGARIVSGSWDNTLKIWDATSGNQLRTLQGHTSGVTSVAFSPDGARIVSGSLDNTLKIWDAASGEELRTLRHKREATSVAFSPDGARIVSGSLDNTVKIWDANTGEELRTLQGHTSGVTSVAFSPDGARIVSGSWDSTLKIWDANTGEELRTLQGHTSGVTSVAFSPDGARIVSGRGDSTLKIWDATSGEELPTLHGHNDRVTSVAFSHDGARVASGSLDNTVKVWDAKTGEELRTLQGHNDWITSVAFSPDGSRIYSSSLKDQFVWDAESGRQMESEPWLEINRANRLSSDRRWLVTPSRENVLLIDLEFGDRPYEKALRVSKAKLNPIWQSEQAQIAEQKNDWCAATFHRAWVMKANPDQATAYDQLHAAYQQWRNLVENKTAIQKNNTLDLDILLQPIVREMLKLPRGSKNDN